MTITIHNKFNDRFFNLLLMAGFFQLIYCSDKIAFTGKVLDKNTREALAYTYILVNNSFVAVTDSLGNFNLMIRHGDRLSFSHLGYLSDIYVLNDSIIYQQSPVIFYLDIQNFRIQEVTIFPFKDYDSFKKAVINKPPTTEQKNSRENMTLTRKHLIEGIVTEYDADLNYRHDLRQVFEKRQPIGIPFKLGNTKRSISKYNKKQKSGK